MVDSVELSCAGEDKEPVRPPLETVNGRTESRVVFGANIRETGLSKGVPGRYICVPWGAKICVPG